MADLIFFGIGLLAFLGACYILILNGRHKNKWTKTTGKVIGLIEKSDIDRDGNTLKYPVIEYSDSRNIKTTVQSKIGVSPSPYSVGDDITFYYDPESPSDILIHNFMYEFLVPLIFLLVGLIFMVSGMANVIK